MSLTLILVILLLIINIQILGLIVVKKLQFSALKVSKNDFEMESVIMRKDNILVTENHELQLFKKNLRKYKS